ncbi:hypothetical protein HPG69_008348, partial [Diceros bicornis minor]
RESQTRDVLKKHCNGSKELLGSSWMRIHDPLNGEAAILGGIEQNEKLWGFTKKASHIQLDNLSEVLYWLMHLVYLLNWIKELIEKPGDILVQWRKVYDDFTAHDCRLQFCKTPNVKSQFRVCARGYDQQGLSPWSIPNRSFHMDAS